MIRTPRLDLPNKKRRPSVSSDGVSGWGEIRTRETVARPHAFQACALNHSATHPERRVAPSVAAVSAEPRNAERRTQRARRFVQPTGSGSNSRDSVNGRPVIETGAFSHWATWPREPRRLGGQVSWVTAAAEVAGARGGRAGARRGKLDVVTHRGPLPRVHQEPHAPALKLRHERG